MTLEAKPSLARALAPPLLLTLGIASLTLVTRIQSNPHILWTFYAVAALLGTWTVALAITSLARGRPLSVGVLLQKQHYLQACVHLSIFTYWGQYWDEVYGHAYLIAGQLMFACALDMLLSLSRHGTYNMGFGPFPVVFSINLFMWFRDDWFYWQFVIVALGFLAKEFLRWQKDGRSAHIFNPSSLPLAIVSMVLIFTGTSDLTWALEISISQFWPAHMYLFLFLVALPGQFFFGVTLMTLSAALTTYLIGLIYFATTGTYFFYDSYIPIASFLGMNLLFTDPSTAPRSELGRIAYGVFYGATVVGLDALGVSYYDKLLQVPLMNLSVQLIDRAVQSPLLKRLDPAQWAPTLTGQRRHLAYMGIWATVFMGLSALQGVGDDHPGQKLTFWQQACQAHNARACNRLATLEDAYCAGGSGWACNELALNAHDSRQDDAEVINALVQGCNHGFPAACTNTQQMVNGNGGLIRMRPTVEDYRVVLMGSKGKKLAGLSPDELFQRACVQGWPDTCHP